MTSQPNQPTEGGLLEAHWLAERDPWTVWPVLWGGTQPVIVFRVPAAWAHSFGARPLDLDLRLALWEMGRARMIVLMAKLQNRAFVTLLDLTQAPAFQFWEALVGSPQLTFRVYTERGQVREFTRDQPWLGDAVDLGNYVTGGKPWTVMDAQLARGEFNRMAKNPDQFWAKYETLLRGGPRVAIPH